MWLKTDFWKCFFLVGKKKKVTSVVLCSILTLDFSKLIWMQTKPWPIISSLYPQRTAKMTEFNRKHSGVEIRCGVWYWRINSTLLPVNFHALFCSTYRLSSGSVAHVWRTGCHSFQSGWPSADHYHLQSCLVTTRRDKGLPCWPWCQFSSKQGADALYVELTRISTVFPFYWYIVSGTGWHQCGRYCGKNGPNCWGWQQYRHTERKSPLALANKYWTYVIVVDDCAHTCHDRWLELMICIENQ